MAKRKPKTIFASPAERPDELYVLMACVVTPLVAMIDGLSMTFFGKDRKAYMKVDEAITWLENELTTMPEKHRERASYENRIAALKLAKERLAKGEFETT